MSQLMQAGHEYTQIHACWAYVFACLLGSLLSIIIGCNCTKGGGNVLLMATEWCWSHQITVIDSWPPCLADGGHLNQSNTMTMFKLKITQLMNRGCVGLGFKHIYDCNDTYWVCRNPPYISLCTFCWDETGLTWLKGKLDQKWHFGRMNPS